MPAIRGVLRWVLGWLEMPSFVPAVCTGNVYANPTPTASPLTSLTPTGSVGANPTPTGEVTIDELG